MKLLSLSRLTVVCLLALSPAGSAPLLVLEAAPGTEPVLTLPRKEGSLRFAIMGDNGRGTREQYEVAAQMAAFHKVFPFDFVIMLGDNIYGTDSAADMAKKFETPYKPLLDAGVVFRACLGNHDNPNQRFYKLFNMDGQRYYTFRGPHGAGVRFFALDSNYLDKVQLDWVSENLERSDSSWKIVFFHHPLYSSGRAHGPSLESRAALEPLFVKFGVSAVFAGHEHFYERTKPQKGGIVHWISGAAGSLRKGNIKPTDITAKGFDRDYHFMLAEIDGEDMYYQAISRTGETVDSGVLRRPGAPAPDASPSPKPSPVPVAAPTGLPPARSTPEGPGPSPSPAASPAGTPAAVPSPAVSPSATPTPEPTVKPSPSPTPKPTPKPKATPKPKPTPRPKATPAPKPTPKPSASPS